MAPKGVESELLELFEKARKAADIAAADDGPVEAEEERCLDALKALRAVPVTMAILVSTQVGKRLRNLTKHPRGKIRTVASDLLDVWKKLVTSETLSNNGNKASKSEDKQSKPVKVEVNANKAESVKVEKKVKVEVDSTSNKKASSSSNGPPKLTGSWYLIQKHSWELLRVANQMITRQSDLMATWHLSSIWTIAGICQCRTFILYLKILNALINLCY